MNKENFLHNKAGDLASTYKSQDDHLKVVTNSYKENLGGHLEAPTNIRRSRKASYDEISDKPTVQMVEHEENMQLMNRINPSTTIEEKAYALQYSSSNLTENEH